MGEETVGEDSQTILQRRHAGWGKVELRGATNGGVGSISSILACNGFVSAMTSVHGTVPGGYQATNRHWDVVEPPKFQ